MTIRRSCANFALIPRSGSLDDGFSIARVHLIMYVTSSKTAVIVRLAEWTGDTGGFLSVVRACWQGVYTNEREDLHVRRRARPASVTY